MDFENQNTDKKESTNLLQPDNTRSDFKFPQDTLSNLNNQSDNVYTINQGHSLEIPYESIQKSPTKYLSAEYTHNEGKGSRKQSQFDIDRQGLKLSKFAATVLQFKSSMGLGIFACCFAMGKVGYLWGLLISLILCYVVTYGMMTVENLCKQIEMKNMDPNFLSSRGQETGFLSDDYIKTFHDLAYYCSKNFGIIIGIFAVQFVSTINISIFSANVTNIAHFLSSTTGISMLEAKVAFALIILVVIAFTIEQEKMIWLAIPPSIMVIALCFTMSTHNILFDNEAKVNSRGEKEIMKVKFF